MMVRMEILQLPFQRSDHGQRPPLARKADFKRRIGFNLRDNAFTALDDPEAVALADSFGHLAGARSSTASFAKLIFDERAMVSRVHHAGRRPQAEYATDLIFTSRESLAGLYSRLLDHAAIVPRLGDILTFLGRRFHPRFDGEVLTSCQKDQAVCARTPRI